MQNAPPRHRDSLLTPVQAGEYAQAVRDAVATVRVELLSAGGASAEHRLLLLDLNAIMLAWVSPLSDPSNSTPAWHALLSDGLHLNELGNTLLFDHLARLIDEQAPSIKPDSLTLDMPLWREVANASLAAAAESLDDLALARLHAAPRPW